MVTAIACPVTREPLADFIASEAVVPSNREPHLRWQTRRYRAHPPYRCRRRLHHLPHAFAIVNDVESVAVSDDRGATVRRLTPRTNGDLDALYFNAIADVIISGARQVDAIAHERAIVVDTVGRTERLELDQTFLTSQYRVVARSHGGYLKKRLQGGEFWGLPAGRQVNPILRGL